MISYTNFRQDVPTVELAQVVEFLDNKRKPITEKDRVAGPYPYYGANGVQDYVADWIFDEDLILLAEDGGHFENPDRGVAYKITGKTWVNNHAHVLRAKKVDVDYLKHVLKNMDLMPYVNGATRLKLTKSSAEKIKIPLPPLAEQQRIAAILDKAAEIKAKREQAITKLYELAQRVFEDMFGDVVANDKGWTQLTIEEIAANEKYSIVDGPFGSSLKPADYLETGVPVVRIANVTKGGDFFAENLLYISKEKFTELKRSSIHAEDVLVTRVGTIGNTCIFPSDFGDALLSTTGVCKIKPNRQLVLPTYLHAAIKTKSFQTQINKSASTSVQKYFNLSALKSWKISVPPLAQQNQFATKIEALKSQITKHQHSLRQTEILASSLQHQAFTTGFNA